MQSRGLREAVPKTGRRVCDRDYTDVAMSPPWDATPIRVALIDDDSGLITVLDRRFAALGWERQVLSYAAGPEQLAARASGGLAAAALSGQ